MNQTAADLVQSVTDRLAPLDLALAEAWWESSTHASPEADARRAAADLARRQVLADPDAFAAVKTARADAAAVTDPLVARSLDLLHDGMLPHQLPVDLLRALVDLETAVDARYTEFRADLGGERVDDNTLLEVLRTSTDSADRRAAWEAGKQIGAEVADDVRALARLRNDGARALGYRDHFALALATCDLDEARLFATLDEVDRLTEAPFREWKGSLDERLARRFGITPDALAPWHLDDPFFQDPPVEGAVDLDPCFAGADLEALTRRTFAGIGLDIDRSLATSDLYARPGKSQHAFCIHLDRGGDVRVLCNVEPNERWADTMLHEFGHAVYDLDLDAELPWLLREPAHACTTEGIAMMFGRLVRDPVWLRDVAGVDAATLAELAPRLDAASRASLLVFARWVLVVTHFERRLYADPDADLDTLWWDLVERFQLVRRPTGRSAPDWAAKIHLAVVPVYYQNYLYGELFASQLLATLRERAGGLVDRAEAGALLRDTVFRPGARLRWDHLVEQATGAPLGAGAFAADLAAGGEG
ncbi:MAG: M2 family metallopeptidase [Acidimicrobiia bacterium]|jgi:peptidyl-dipeptidase A